MAIGYSGHAAARVDNNLEQMLADAFERQMATDQAADADEQRGIANRMAQSGLDLRQREFDAERGHEAAMLGEARAARTAAADKAAFEGTARRNMSELLNNPQQLAAFSLASGVEVPAGVRELTKPKEVKLHKVTTADAQGRPLDKMFTEDELRAGVRAYREPKGNGDGGKGQRMWLQRGGEEVYGFYQPGDKRAETKSNSSTPEQQAKSRESLTTIVSTIRDLSSKINTGQGFGAKVEGLARSGAAALGIDNTVSEYHALLSGALPLLARAYGHTGVLTQQDVDSVKEAFPKTGDNSALALAKLKNVEKIMLGLHDAGEKALAGGGAPPPPGGGGAVEEWTRGADGKPTRKKK